jgi:hypothetical protein
MFAESMIQPFLFDEFEIIDTAKPDLVGKRLVSKINKLRRALSPNEREFDFYLAVAVREIKSVSSLDSDKQSELVLTCLETCCHTWAEIEEQSHLPALKVREIINQLNAQGLIYGRKRHTIGGSANQQLIFSRRKPCSCE